jgi:hypothetical protein
MEKTSLFFKVFPKLRLFLWFVLAQLKMDGVTRQFKNPMRGKKLGKLTRYVIGSWKRDCGVWCQTQCLTHVNQVLSTSESHPQLIEVEISVIVLTRVCPILDSNHKRLVLMWLPPSGYPLKGHITYQSRTGLFDTLNFVCYSRIKR